MLDAHEKLMLRRHLEAAIRFYTVMAEAADEFGYGNNAYEWREAATDAQLMIEKLTK